MAKDLDLFAKAMAGAAVKPLKSRRRRSDSSPPLGGEARRGGDDVRSPLSQPLPLTGERRKREAAQELSLDDAGFDRDISRALSRGKLVPQASVDLHGMTVAAAERAVRAFLDRAVAQDLRLVLVVTGKGVRLEGGRVFGGRIRAELLGWLNRVDNRTQVRAVRAAHPRHGGSGAFYVLLRRRSSASNRSLRAVPQR
ncbi:MAG: Smr/MutS family protein [Alphaproteobacteria bacterium]|nr:Smr/MutS family protein [Alphaproteobacteria bacterium]MBV8409778.1 Smr/MutS family protein [Alphaproteobacteria bacterium]